MGPCCVTFLVILSEAKDLVRQKRFFTPLRSVQNDKVELRPVQILRSAQNDRAGVGVACRVVAMGERADWIEVEVRLGRSVGCDSRFDARTIVQYAR